MPLGLWFFTQFEFRLPHVPIRLLQHTAAASDQSPAGWPLSSNRAAASTGSFVGCGHVGHYVHYLFS
jgi:hypothetical protein